MKPSPAVWTAVSVMAVLTLCLVSCAVTGSKTASSVPETEKTQTETVRSEAGPAAPEPGVGEETEPAETEAPVSPSEPEMESQPTPEADSGPMILEAMPQESITPVSFEGIEPAKNLGRFIDEVILPSRKGNDNSAKDVGMIVSPYYTLTANGTDVPCYAVRTRYGAHSFAMIDVREDAFPIELSAGVLVDFRSAAILPESYGVEAQVSDHTVTVGDDATAQIDGLTFSNIRILFSNNKIRVCNRSKAGGTIDNVLFKDIYRKGTAATDSKSLGLSLSKFDESSIRVSRTAP